MTIAADIIRFAFREGDLLQAESRPTATQETEALERLNRMVQSTYGSEMGEELTDWPVPAPQRTASEAANYPQLPYPQGLDGITLSSPLANSPTLNIYPYPPANSRIVFGSVTNTVWFPEAPNDGSRMAVVQGSGAGDGGVGGATLTLDGNGRTIETANTQAYNQPITARSWLYRADTGDLVAVVDMTLTSQMPFPSDLDDLWICGLAKRLAPRYSRPVTPETVTELKRMQGIFKARYRQAANTVYGSSDYPRSVQSFIQGQWFW